MRSLVYLPSTTTSDIVASPSLATSPDCRTALQHIKPYSLTSTSHSVVSPIHPGVVGLVAHVADGSTKSETTPARQALGRGHHGRATAHAGYAMVMMKLDLINFCHACVGPLKCGGRRWAEHVRIFLNPALSGRWASEPPRVSVPIFLVL